MKARFVNEKQNFKRGLDPKKSMDIGMTTEMHLDYFWECYEKLKKILPESDRDPIKYKSYLNFETKIGAYVYSIYYDFLGEEAGLDSERPLHMKIGWGIKKQEPFFASRKYYPFLLSGVSFEEISDLICEILLEDLNSSISTYMEWLEKAEKHKEKVEKYKDGI